MLATLNNEANDTLRDLAGGVSLEGFAIEFYTEVYSTDRHGSKGESCGYFKDESLADSFIRSLPNSAGYGKGSAFLLTDGKIAFVLGDPAKLIDEEKAAFTVGQAVVENMASLRLRSYGV